MYTTVSNKLSSQVVKNKKTSCESFTYEELKL